MPAAQTRPRHLIGSFDKGLRILELVVTSDHPLRLQDVANAIGIDKSSALRFMATLQRHGLVERQTRGKTFVAGPKLALWSSNLQAGTVIAEAVRPSLRKLTEMTRQTSHLALLRDDRVVLVEVMPSEGPVAVRQTPGDWDPLYCSAVGKAILAFLPIVEQRELIDRIAFRELTPATTGSPEALRIELRAVVRDRLAYDEAENNPQVSCMAAPVLDRSGYPVASIGISMISALHPGGIRRQRAIAAAVKQMAEEVTRHLHGAPGPTAPSRRVFPGS